MVKNLLALVGVLLILVGACLGTTVPGAIIWSLIGLLLGIVLTIPWWRDRLRQENRWWEKRDEPLDTPPRIPS
ncbi:MAG: hypothetical protein CL608_28405 [Anaerolineaceae bacterium]|nr:hypothetical protein [Anaerolineaceae bacterium]